MVASVVILELRTILNILFGYLFTSLTVISRNYSFDYAIIIIILAVNSG